VQVLTSGPADGASRRGPCRHSRPHEESYTIRAAQNDAWQRRMTARPSPTLRLGFSEPPSHEKLWDFPSKLAKLMRSGHLQTHRRRLANSGHAVRLQLPRPARGRHAGSPPAQCSRHVQHRGTWMARSDRLFDAADARARARRRCTRNSQGWPNFWVNFQPLIGVLRQNIGPACTIRAGPVKPALPHSSTPARPGSRSRSSPARSPTGAGVGGFHAALLHPLPIGIVSIDENRCGRMTRSPPTPGRRRLDGSAAAGAPLARPRSLAISIRFF
jgi:hypothetical protein